jgi:hypothetical protein
MLLLTACSDRGGVKLEAGGSFACYCESSDSMVDTKIDTKLTQYIATVSLLKVPVESSGVTPVSTVEFSQQAFGKGAMPGHEIRDYR